MLKITDYLFSLGVGEIKDMFAARLKNLKTLLRSKKV